MTWSYVLFGYVFLPLVAVAYAAFAVWLLWRVAATRLPRWLRLALIVSIPLVFVLILAGDAIVGRNQFAQLCESDAGVNVLKPVVLEKKYRRRDGSPNLTSTPGRQGYQIGDRYEMKFFERQISSWPRINRVTTEIRDVQRDEVLGRQVNFQYWGGWLAQRMPGHLTADSCPQLRDQRASLENVVFQMTN